MVDDEWWGTDPESLFPYPVERSFYVECLGRCGWYFICTVRDLQSAIELMATYRTIKGQPARITQKFLEKER